MMTRQAALLQCQNMGFDGLARVSSPEEFNDVVRATKNIRSVSNLWVGLSYHANTNTDIKVYWNGMGPVAADLPWRSEDTVPSSWNTCVVIDQDGFLDGQACESTSYALCEMFSSTSREARGVYYNSAKPANVSSTAISYRARSLLECVTRCSDDDKCRVAWFDSSLLTCTPLRHEEYTGLEDCPDARTFVREVYRHGFNNTA
ncbi:hypothetical protein EGW08_012294 [Elysia chlorotica]|uniref:C-type lectin domain-containing protein n=1 Tax=Elysia chlorotica TaxID=188477 RepID=A0A433TEH5_ELYCH|nr:hypothetical protein EGW08_012294 [Elysia chlorotica]